MNTWDLLVRESQCGCMQIKSLGLCFRQKKSCYSLPVSFLLLYLHFMCLPAAHTSSGVLWGTGGVFSSLTNMVEIACRLTMGVHLDLGHTLFVVAPLPPFFHSSLVLCFSNSVKWKSSCLTSFHTGCRGLDPQDRTSHEGHLQQDVGLVIAVVNNSCLISCLFPIIEASLIIRKHFYRRYVLFVSLFLNTFISFNANNKTTS